ncbi:hypothetical protein [Streptomyces sp. NPDC059994]|uniref:hypothetical protein n=1 Tax=Streptomyces sp. NPDC059994 TaxID=3347029 RepID=UPI00368815E0
MRRAGASGEWLPKAEQSATDCCWSWSPGKRAERRVWEVKTVPTGKLKLLVPDRLLLYLEEQFLTQVEKGR